MFLSSVAFAEKACQPRPLQVNDQILSSNFLGRVTDINKDGYVKVTGLPWPTDQYYNPALFCLFLPTSSFGGFKSGDMIVEIANGYMADVYKVKDFSENGYVGYADTQPTGIYRMFNRGPYEHVHLNRVTEFKQFRLGSCVKRFSLDLTDKAPGRSYKITDILAEGFIKTNERHRNYFIYSRFALDETNNCF